MRRMYSQNELESIIKEVFLADVESGEIDFAGLIADSLENMDVVAKSISADSIIESMSGYTFTAPGTDSNTYTKNILYKNVVKNGNKLTFGVALEITRISDTIGNYHPSLGYFSIPEDIAAELIPNELGFLSCQNVVCAITENTALTRRINISKESSVRINMTLRNANELVLNTKYFLRFEFTFLLGNSLD